MESLSQRAISSAASAREACTRELTHVPIEAQLLAGHHIRGGYELADCVHFCYSPLFYDAVFFTPLHQILSEALK